MQLNKINGQSMECMMGNHKDDINCNLLSFDHIFSASEQHVLIIPNDIVNEMNLTWTWISSRMD